MDNHTLKQRSYNMSQIKSSDTKLELLFRKFLLQNGIRGYRIKNKIFGKPDLYFPVKKIAVFIDGCFWHKCPEDFIKPKSKNDYWDKKIKDNVARDKKVSGELGKQGIKVLRFWGHEITNNMNACMVKVKKNII